MAIKDWTSTYPATISNTSSNQVDLVNVTDKTRVSQIHAVRDDCIAVQTELGATTPASGSIRWRVQEIESSGSVNGPYTSIQFNQVGATSGSKDLVWEQANSLLGISGSITASQEISASSFYGDGSNLSGISASPLGPLTSVQFNQASNFSGSKNLVWEQINSLLGVSGSITASQGVSASFISASGYYGNGSGLSGVVASATPGGPYTSIQFNQAGATSGSKDLVWEQVNSLLGVTGSITASAAISASEYYGDGSNLSGVASAGAGGTDFSDDLDDNSLNPAWIIDIPSAGTVAEQNNRLEISHSGGALDWYGGTYTGPGIYQVLSPYDFTSKIFVDNVTAANVNHAGIILYSSASQANYCRFELYYDSGYKVRTVIGAAIGAATAVSQGSVWLCMARRGGRIHFLYSEASGSAEPELNAMTPIASHVAGHELTFSMFNNVLSLRSLSSAGNPSFLHYYNYFRLTYP